MLRYGRFFAWSVLLKEIEERYARRDVCNTSFRFNAFAQQLLTLSFTSKCASDQLWCKPICNTTADVYAYWGSYCGLQVKRLMRSTEAPPRWVWKLLINKGRYRTAGVAVMTHDPIDLNLGFLWGDSLISLLIIWRNIQSQRPHFTFNQYFYNSGMLTSIWFLPALFSPFYLHTAISRRPSLHHEAAEPILQVVSHSVETSLHF